MKRGTVILALAAVVLTTAAPALLADPVGSLADGTLSCTPVYYADYSLYLGYDVVVDTSKTIDAQAVETHITGTWDLSGLTGSNGETWVAIGLIPKSRYDSTWEWGDYFPGGSGEYVFNRGVFQLTALEGDWYYAKISDYSGDYYGFPSVYEYWSGAGPRPPGMAPAKKISAGGDATFSFDARLLPNPDYGGNMNLAVTGGNPGYTSSGFELGGAPPTAPDGTGYLYGRMSFATDPLTEDFSECYLYAAMLVWSGSNPGSQSASFSNVGVHVVPEPFSMAFMASALVGVVACRLRKRRQEGTH